jgi:hypothetical protein
VYDEELRCALNVAKGFSCSGGASVVGGLLWRFPLENEVAGDIGELTVVKFVIVNLLN